MSLTLSCSKFHLAAATPSIIVRSASFRFVHRKAFVLLSGPKSSRIWWLSATSPCSVDDLKPDIVLYWVVVVFVRQFWLISFSPILDLNISWNKGFEWTYISTFGKSSRTCFPCRDVPQRCEQPIKSVFYTCPCKRKSVLGVKMLQQNENKHLLSL